MQEELDILEGAVRRALEIHAILHAMLQDVGQLELDPFEIEEPDDENER